MDNEKQKKSQKNVVESLEVIRTDIKRIFLEVSLVAVNAWLFLSNKNPHHQVQGEVSPSEVLSQLRLLETEVIFYGDYQCDFLHAYRTVIKNNGHTVLKDRDCVFEKLEQKDCVLLASEDSDIDFFPFAAFCAASVSAPFLLKTESDYVSSYEGELAFTEIANLVVNSKKRG